MTSGHILAKTDADQNDHSLVGCAVTANGEVKTPTKATKSVDIVIPMNDVPAFTPSRKLRIGIIGAGYSGLIMAHKLMYEQAEKVDNIVNFTIFESKSVPGGTWVDNTLSTSLSITNLDSAN
jgi:hypothetical protein